MSSYFQTPVHVIGGSGGSSFTYYGGTNGKVLTKIGVWTGGWQVKAIRIWLTDSDPRTFGQVGGSYMEFTFRAGERMTRLSLWGNGAGTRSGGIRFFTDKGAEFFHKMTSWGLKQEYPIDVASGICVGVMGRHGEDIDCLGFVFLRPLSTARLVNVRYPELAFNTAGIQAVTLEVYHDRNESPSMEKAWRNASTRTVTESRSWSFTTGLEVFTSVSVQAGIPSIAEVQGQFGWTVSTSATHAVSSEASRTLEWERSGVLAPLQWMIMEVTTRRGTLNGLRYDATMEVTLVSGAVIRYDVRGEYAGVEFSNTSTNLSTGSISGKGLQDEPRALENAAARRHDGSIQDEPPSPDALRDKANELQEWTL